jgi:hypothetical protein
VKLTIASLSVQTRRQLTTGELFKFFVVLILGTRYEFGSRSDLWNTTESNRFLVAPAFGNRTGMPRGSFDDIWSSLTFSDQGVRRLEEGSDSYRRRLVHDIV